MDYGVENDVPFLVMNYAPNGTVRQRHPRGTYLPLSLVISYAKQIASALTYAHNERLVHRDLKPDNLLIGRHEDLLLSDFGIAVVIRTERSLSSQDIAGTPAYMAPEQFFGKASPASDQYALGVIVYEWLCGEHPFPGGLVRFLSNATPPSPLRQQLPGISPALEQVVMQALARDPRQRFSSVQAFVQALEVAWLTTQAGIRPSLTLPAVRPSLAQPAIRPSSVQSVVRPSLTQTPAWSSSSAPSAGTERNKRPTISRRTMLLGLGGAAGLALGGASLARFLSSSSSTTSPVGPGATLHVYTPTLPTLGKATSVGWSPNGRYVASSYGPTSAVINPVIVWSAQPPFQKVQLLSHSAELNQMAWSYDSAQIASGGGDKVVRVWDVASGRLLVEHQQGSTVDSVAWSPKAMRLASGSSDNLVRVWSADKDDPPSYVYTGHTDHVWAVAWSPDGQFIASGGSHNDRTVRVWNANSGELWQAYTQHGGHISGVCWSPDGAYIASCSYDQTVRVWKVASAETVLTHTHTEAVGSVAWSPDGRWIVSTASTVLQVWDAFHGNVVRSRSDGRWIASSAWSPQSFGHYVAYSDDPNSPPDAPQSAPNDSGQVYTFQVM
jgi:WD40 repeat protein